MRAAWTLNAIQPQQHSDVQHYQKAHSQTTSNGITSDKYEAKCVFLQEGKYCSSIQQFHLPSQIVS